MKLKLSFHDYKNIQRMSQKELSAWVESIYKSGYEDGRVASDIIDMDIVKEAIRNTRGIGNILYKRICDKID